MEGHNHYEASDNDDNEESEKISLKELLREENVGIGRRFVMIPFVNRFTGYESSNIAIDNDNSSWKTINDDDKDEGEEEEDDGDGEWVEESDDLVDLPDLEPDGPSRADIPEHENTRGIPGLVG